MFTHQARKLNKLSVANWRSHRHSNISGRSIGQSSTDFVQINVGGFPYSIAWSDINKFPGSFLQSLIKKEWINNSTNTISIQRDGALFKFVYAYIVAGHLPRNNAGLIDLDNVTLSNLKEEANFYGLNELSKECSIPRRKNSDSCVDFHSYFTMRKYITHLREHKGSLEIDLSSNLVRALKCNWSPFCVLGEYYANDLNLLGNSSIRKIDVKELIAVATQSPFGRGTETVVDTAVRNSFEIDASHLNSAALNDIASSIKCDALAPHLKLTLRPYKLVIYKKGGHFNEHRDTVRGDGHIGTVVVVLNSKYTGGELEVTHGGRTEVVTVPYSWVAMYGDCLHKINPVRSGTRVSLIYDIYGKKEEVLVGADKQSDRNEEDEEEEEEEEEDEEDEDDEFWIDWRYKVPKSPPDRRRDPTEAESKHIYKALDQELKSFDSIVICLQHLYPECQTNPAFLKGGDRTLYDILTERSDTFDVQVVAATIYRHHEYEYEYDNEVKGALFSPSIVKRTLGIKTDSDDETEKGPAAVEGKERKKQKVKPAASLGRSKLVLPNSLNPDSVLDYTPYAQHTGNEPQAEQSVYIVAGLQVRRKKRVKKSV